MFGIGDSLGQQERSNLLKRYTADLAQGDSISEADPVVHHTVARGRTGRGNLSKDRADLVLSLLDCWGNENRLPVRWYIWQYAKKIIRFFQVSMHLPDSAGSERGKDGMRYECTGRNSVEPRN